MIDLHNHILPGVDDGPATLEQSLQMARQAVQTGTTILAATPHRFSAGREQTALFILERTARLQSAMDDAGIALALVPGIEMTMRPDTPAMIESGQLLPLGGALGSHVLVEPPFDRIPRHAAALLASILAMGFTPVLAHPERNSEIQNHLAFVEYCAANGIPVQLTAGSIVGKFGDRAKQCAKRIATETACTIVIASDAHDPFDRTPGDLREAVATVSEWTGDPIRAEQMVTELPRRMLQPRFPAPEPAASAGESNPRP